MPLVILRADIKQVLGLLPEMRSTHRLDGREKGWFYMNYIYRISKEEYEKALKYGAESIVSDEFIIESAEVFEVYGNYYLRFTKKG